MQRRYTPKDKNAPKKGFYIKKLSSANNQNDLKHQSELQLIQLAPRKSKAIRKKGSEVAKDARQRKKQYVKYLQHRNATLFEQNQNLRRQILDAQSIHSKQLNDQELRIKILIQENSHFEGVASLFQNLYLAITSEDKCQTEKNLSLMRDKFGISGRNRVQQIQNLFKKIIKAIMPMHYRLLMQTCADAKSFFELLSGKSFIKGQLFSDQEKRILLNTRPAFIEAKNQYNNLLGKLYELKESLIQLNYRHQRIVDKVQSNLTPLFVGKLLINLDHERNKQGTYEKIYPLNYWQGLADIKNPKSETVKENFREYFGDQFQYENDLHIFQHIYDDEFI